MKFCPECGAKQEETEKNEDVKQVEVVEETNSDEKKNQKLLLKTLMVKLK